jgi:hypothetical protein
MEWGRGGEKREERKKKCNLYMDSQIRGRKYIFGRRLKIYSMPHIISIIITKISKRL